MDLLTDGLNFDIEKGSEFFELVRNMANTDGTVVRRTLHVPLLHEVACSDGELVAAVGVSDL